LSAVLVLVKHLLQKVVVSAQHAGLNTRMRTVASAEADGKCR
jgi:hypothetical protein